MKLTFLLAALGLALVPFFAGCQSVDAGRPIRKDYPATLVPHRTTYAEIVSELGEPLMFIEGKRAVAYRWETHNGEYYFFGKSGLMNDRVRALGLKFDDLGRFNSHAYFSAADPEALRRQIEDWTKQDGASP